jgi:hypothetical protein
MDSFKKKNKKNARRFGMNKKELLSLALAGAGILGLAAGNVIAGMAVIPKNVALEIIPTSSSNTTGTVQSNQIAVDGILAANGTTITLQLNNGYFPGNAAIGLCSDDNTLVANGTVSSADNSTVVLRANQTIGSAYVLRVVSNGTGSTLSCTSHPTDGVPVKIKGGLNAGDTVDLTVGTFTGTLFKVKQQYTATLTKATDYIDPDKGYKELKVGTTTSNATYYINDSNPDYGVNTTTDNFTVSLSSSDPTFSGVKEAKVYAPIGNTTSLLTLNATSNWTGSNSIGNFIYNGTINITVTGNDTLTTRTFTVSLKTVPGTGNIAREIFLLQNVVSHEWLLPGVTYYIPFVVARPGDETYIVLQAKKGVTSSYTVTISALDDNGDLKSINAIPMNAGDRLVIKASDIKTQIPSLTKDKFAVMINVDGDESQIFAYAHVCSVGAGCKRVPVKTSNGKIVE